MNLNTTLKSLQVVLGEVTSTSELDVTASYGDFTSAGLLPGSDATVTNGTTPVTAVAAPAVNVERIVKEVRVHNNDTIDHTVFLLLNDNGTLYIVDSETVVAGGNYAYTEGKVCCPSSGGGGGGAALLLETGSSGLKISALPAAGALVGNEPLPVVQGGVTTQTDPQSVLNIGTITPADAAGGSGNNGVSLQFIASKGDGVGNGGETNLYAGDGGASGQGGTVVIRTGKSGAGAGFGISGGFYVYGADGLGTNSGGGVQLRAGNTPAYGPFIFNHAKMYAGNGFSGAYAGSVYLGAGIASGGGLSGQILLNSDPSFIDRTFAWQAGTTLNSRTIYTATRAERVTAVIGHIDAATGGAATLVVEKRASGVAPGAGVSLSSNSVDLNGTPNNNQTLTLAAIADITLAAGDCLGLVTTGTVTISAGSVTIHSTPQ